MSFKHTRIHGVENAADAAQIKSSLRTSSQHMANLSFLTLARANDTTTTTAAAKPAAAETEAPAAAVTAAAATCAS